MLKKLIFISLFFLNLNGMINQEDAKKIGMQIWQNEASGRIDLLVFWNPNESFPSLGIGHNIWFPENKTYPYTEEFPKLCNYLIKNNINLPEWLMKAKEKGAPWKNRAEFLEDNIRTSELRELLSQTINLQINFLIERLDNQWPLILNSTPSEYQNRLSKNFELMRSTLLGNYSLIDYLNFKGAGTNPLEITKGYRWGLLQVLLDLPDDVTKENINQAFTVSAAKTLIKLIEKSAPIYNRLRFMLGWIKRINTYSNPELFN